VVGSTGHHDDTIDVVFLQQGRITVEMQFGATGGNFDAALEQRVLGKVGQRLSKLPT